MLALQKFKVPAPCLLSEYRHTTPLRCAILATAMTKFTMSVPASFFFLKCLRQRQQCVRFRAPNFQTIHNTHAKPQLLLARNGQSRKGWGNAAQRPPLPSNEEPQQANSLKKGEMKKVDITKRADSVSVHTNCPRMAVQNYRAGK